MTAELHAFLDARHTQPRRTGLDGRAGDRRRAVAVPVGLDHREHLRGRDEVAESTHVGADRAEIHFAPHGAATAAALGHVVSAR